MPLYYFHVSDGSSTPDTEGTELKDIAAAKCEAVKLAGRLICDAAATFWDQDDWSLSVSDQSGMTLFSLYFVGVEAPVLKADPLRQRAAS